jgi:hypothetical protein
MPMGIRTAIVVLVAVLAMVAVATGYCFAQPGVQQEYPQPTSSDQGGIPVPGQS